MSYIPVQPCLLSMLNKLQRVFKLGCEWLPIIKYQGIGKQQPLSLDFVMNYRLFPVKGYTRLVVIDDNEKDFDIESIKPR